MTSHGNSEIRRYCSIKIVRLRYDMWETRDIIGTVKDYGQGKFVEIKNVRENLIITNEIFPGFPISSINASIVSVSSNNVTDISKFKSFKGNSFVPPASANHTLAKRFDVTSRHFFLDISHHLFHFLYKIALTAFNVLQSTTHMFNYPSQLHFYSIHILANCIHCTS